jgi:hypothetical protein
MAKLLPLLLCFLFLAAAMVSAAVEVIDLSLSALMLFLPALPLVNSFVAFVIYISI